MEQCFVGIKESDVQYLNTLRKRLGPHTSLTLQGSGLLKLEMNTMTMFIVLDEMKQQNSCSLRKIVLHDVSPDVKSKSCKRLNGCAVFQMYGPCCSNCELRGKK